MPWELIVCGLLTVGVIIGAAIMTVIWGLCGSAGWADRHLEDKNDR